MTIYEVFYDFYTALFTPEIITEYEIIFMFLSFVSSLSLVYMLLMWAYSVVSRFTR